MQQRRVGRIAEELAGVVAGERAHGGYHAAVELHIVVGVEDVVFAVVLILGGDVNGGETGAKFADGADAVLLAAVGV